MSSLLLLREATMADHNLGDSVTITGRIIREGDASNVKRFWQRYDLAGPDAFGYRALIVGVRTLANGYVDRYQETDGWASYTVKTWIAEEHFTAYLVVTDIRTKPFFVLPDQIKE